MDKRGPLHGQMDRCVTQKNADHAPHGTLRCPFCLCYSWDSVAIYQHVCVLHTTDSTSPDVRMGTVSWCG
eukprot:10796991-Karenia_brevis.AAC.1